MTDPERLSLDPLAPDPAWVAGLPAVGATAATAWTARAAWATQLGRHARWFVPLAAAAAVALWMWSARAGAAAPTSRSTSSTTTSLLTAPTDGPTVIRYLLGAAP